MSTKWCYACWQLKSTKKFGKNRSKKDGLASECRECKKISDAKSHQKHQEKRLAKMKEYQQKHSAELKIMGKEYRENHKEAKTIYDRNHLLKNI